MPGGLLNLISQGNQNIYLNGNPTKTFFKTKYAKFTNFGLQKFRIDYEGSRTIRATEDSHFHFKVPRYADLLMDTFLVFRLPFIWSPIKPPLDENSKWAPYEFKWIKNLGSELIKEIKISVGGQVIQQFSGSYLKNMAERDLDSNKKNIYDQMSGNINELNDPANYSNRVNAYPSAYYTDSASGATPSIDSRYIYIPINTWFTLSSKMAFPLIALQYNQLTIDVTIRPLFELFTIRDVKDSENSFPYVQPNFNSEYMQMYNFLQTPPSVELNKDDYVDKRNEFNADVHMVSTYCFLSDEEQRVFSLNEHKYLFKEIHQYNFKNITGSNKIKLDSLGMVSSWMFYFQRSDINLRNEWSNYSNWPYNYPPKDIINAPIDGTWKYSSFTGKNNFENNFESGFGPGVNPTGNPTPWMITGDYTTGNKKDIMETFGIVIDGNYRENIFHHNVFNFIEKYTRTNSGTGNNGLYCYNFCLDNNPYVSQPSGAINMSKFKNIELEFTTQIPTLDPNASFNVICDENGTPIGVNKSTWQIYDYNYDLTIIEERYNILHFVSGNCGLMYSR
tara:strand:- start:4607 stop:6289 length:1683 start_codon:yes stop_codon:yes gene_type:complete